MLFNLLEQVGRYSHFAVRALFASLLSITRPRELMRQFYRVYVGALPLGCVAGIALGIVFWLHLHGVLMRLGSGYAQLLPQALALAVVLEFAPIGAGLIVAGRSGASLGAELGCMRLSEQIDAVEVLGLSPVKQLVAPRVMSCMLAMPLLTVTIAFLAILGGFAAESMGGKMPWQEYQNECLRGLHLNDVLPATLKTVVFGYLIGVTGCYSGMNAHGGTEGVGQAATNGVVLSTFLVLVSDVVLVKAIQLLTGGPS